MCPRTRTGRPTSSPPMSAMRMSRGVIERACRKRSERARIAIAMEAATSRGRGATGGRTSSPPKGRVLHVSGRVEQLADLAHLEVHLHSGGLEDFDVPLE